MSDAEELTRLRENIRAVIGTAGAEAEVMTADHGAGPGDWLAVVRVYAEALEAIGALVDYAPVDTTEEAGK